MAYKQSYISLKKSYNKLVQFGGELPSPLSNKEFIIKYFDMFNASSLRDYAFSDLTDLTSGSAAASSAAASSVDSSDVTVSDESLNIIIKYLESVCLLMWNKMNPLSHAKKNINIFSFGSGHAFVEAYFGNYIRREHEKSVNLIFIEYSTILPKEIIEGYNTFEYYVNFKEDSIISNYSDVMTIVKITNTNNLYFKKITNMLNMYNGTRRLSASHKKEIDDAMENLYDFDILFSFAFQLQSGAEKPASINHPIVIIRFMKFILSIYKKMNINTTKQVIPAFVTFFGTPEGIVDFTTWETYLATNISAARLETDTDFIEMITAMEDKMIISYADKYREGIDIISKEEIKSGRSFTVPRRNLEMDTKIHDFSYLI